MLRAAFRRHAERHCGPADCGPIDCSPNDCSPNDNRAMEDEADGLYRHLVFGVRRPLRFMARALDLSREQTEKLTIILDDLKTERQQGSVDERRTTAQFADALSQESLDLEAVKRAADDRVKSAERLSKSVVRALAETHAMLNPEQKKRLAYLLRSGALGI